MTENNFTEQFNTLDDRRLINLGVFLLLILALISLVSLYTTKNSRKYDSAPSAVLAKIDPFENIALEAKAAMVYDIKRSKVFFEKNADESLPLASLTKIMTAVTALDLLPKFSVVDINAEFLSEEGDSGLYKDEKWKLRDLLDLSLVSSSNDAAAAIAATAGQTLLRDPDLNLSLEEFVRKMNAKAKEIGMTKANFINVTGLDVDTDKTGGYSSARDFIILLEYALKNHPEVFEATRYKTVYLKSLNNLNHKATNTNIGINSIPNIIGSKTGYTEIAGGNLTIIFDPGLARPIAVLVLGSSYDGRFNDVELLTRKTLEAIALEE
ncbi:MAG: hypothetical protein A2741_01245 [Candidatus Zambryskibacteria bacterium RIFCSPHIGHO2_01_FULL_43_27]|uniref:Peptidase S11 D-alanyl-D-alanine carboxypeptidase A N-terminal domain-containing protein n=1 Tax=Candidatus Zambryskibacteria bacterium RIFCSPLOWO2_01_FULL_43_17 TaxID=1802760 RepID=A0A1G2U2C6_9BACT|nr:MAG: hypothetical protein A2741_01245 [Candidatus Zambryskibacteria bacterium RIFCSPHIGHO2_01_FULL_43_27]OHB03667.1 MAG: hypothetical protein A2920_03100 [Candidatus Zambryskibacteria bacterium RIFCSPLOWO2_01_FULL_43_17]